MLRFPIPITGRVLGPEPCHGNRGEVVRGSGDIVGIDIQYHGNREGGEPGRREVYCWPPRGTL